MRCAGRRWRAFARSGNGGAGRAEVKGREVYGNRRLRGLRRRSCGFVRAKPHCEGAEDAAGAA